MAVTPLEAGAAVITVTATDADGTNTAATQRFDVTVANRAPVTVGRLADRAVRINEGPVVVDAADAFRDPDGDALAYRAASSAPTVATVEVSGSAVTVRPLEAGTAAVTVTATDPDGSRQTAMQAFTVAVLAPGTGDYDTDDDGLIEIRNLAQLDAMRHDLQAGGTASHPAHAAAFPHALPAMGCPEEGCTGYELVADLDFDTNANGVADAGDAYWNGGDGWRPIGSNDDPFTATFAGKGHTIAHLFIRSDLGSYYGLFGVAGASGVIRGVGLIDVDVTGSHDVGGLMGRNAGVVTASFVTGRVEAVSSFSRAGGLSGINSGRITASYAAVRVSARSRHARAGGLVGNNFNDGSITASYATGSVVAAGMDCVAGGLVGGNHRGASVAASYATGRVTVSDGGAAGGLVGDNWGTGHVSASYWDTLTSARATGGSGSGQSTSALQTPIGYAGLYQDWDVDVDGDAGADAPWEFGTASQYPALAVDFDGDEQATWQEFGYQAREGPMLTAPSSVDGSRVDLSWTAVDVTHWTPAPVVAYAVYRIEGGHATLHADDVRGLDFVDHFVEVDSTYGYQAAALVADGESSRSTAAPVTTPAQFTTNRGPVAVGTLTPLTLRIVDGTVSVEVADAFRDPDDDALTYAAFSSAPAVVRVSVTGSTVTVTPVATGTATVTVTATDVSGSNASATRALAVTVLPNVGPLVVRPLADRELRVSNGAFSVAVSDAFQDPDDDVLVYRAVSSAPAVARVSVSGSTVTVTPVATGTATVTVTATDVSGSSTDVALTFRVTVLANRAPRVTWRPVVRSLRVEDGEAWIRIANGFRDPDGDVLTYDIRSSSPAVAVSVSDGTAILTPLSGGTATVTATATDPGRLSATLQFEVRVANRPPVPVGLLPALSLRAGDGSVPVAVSGAFEDPDGDALTYGASSSDALVASVSIVGSMVRVTPLWSGTSTVTVTATDRSGSNRSAAQTFRVTVVENRPPAAVGRLPALSLRVSGGVRPVNVAGAFEDPDGDALTCAATSSDPSMVTVSVSGSTVRVTPLASGTVTVTVTAADIGGLRAEQAFEVTVANRSPVAVGTLPPLSLQVAAGAVVVEVSGAFEDPDADALTYGATSAAVTVAAVSLVAGSDGDGDAAVGRFGDGDGDGDRRGRFEHVGDAGVRDERGRRRRRRRWWWWWWPSQPGAGGGGDAGGSGVGGGRGAAVGLVGCVPGP